ncbi:hypothetical protein D5086_009173 [Populus alba]|uniref:Uncharacterized protein n=1 Tax=Populus alba TaxID=43335 RepID=A0ACC4CI47_POPAL
MARIDDVLFVDDATKQCAAAGIHIPLQQRRIRRPPYPESECLLAPSQSNKALLPLRMEPQLILLLLQFLEAQKGCHLLKRGAILRKHPIKS